MVGQNEDVSFELEVDGVDATWGVRTVTLRESVGAPYSGIVEAALDGDDLEIASLLGKSFMLRISRDSQMRVVRGIVRHALVTHPLAETVYALHVVPSTWRLGLGIDTRIYRDMTIPELVQAVVDERLGGAVEVDVAGLSQTYETHEFVVQYQESAWNLLVRWMEQEGIFCFEADSDEGERLVLADSMSNLPFARPGDDGQVRHVGDSAPSDEAEVVFGFHHAQELGVTSVSVAEYDWTNPSLVISEEQSGEFPVEPPPEVYDHTDVATLHRYGGQQYQRNTAARGAQVRHEVLDLMHQRWSMGGNVVTAQPGHVLRVEGAPNGELDGSYMIVRVESGGDAAEGVTGSWKNSLTVVPTAKPFRLPPSTPRPVVPGAETAVVVGPAGQEIHTDEHGRVKVRFHWDRQNSRGAEDSSRWIRVAHNWAGAGFGTFFLPRIGMEVVVMFLGGNPDRPLVTSCVYNGENRAGVVLPDDKTQSVIRTKSSLDSEGFNEFRFEDKAGSEEIYIHAEKDFKEKVKHCHTTIVDVNQSNTVGGTQDIHVQGDYREVHVDHEERYNVDENRALEVGGLHEVTVHGEQLIEVDQREQIKVHGGREIIVDGGLKERVTSGGVGFTVEAGGVSETISGGVERIIQDGGLRTTTIGGVAERSMGDRAITVHGQSTHTATGDNTVEGQQIILRAQQKVIIDAPMGVDMVGGATNVEQRTAFDLTCETFTEFINAVKFSNTFMSISTKRIGISESEFSFSGGLLSISAKGAKMDLVDTVDLSRSPIKIIN